MVDTILVLSVLKTITVFLGFVIVYRGWKAYRLRRDRPMFWLTAGIAVLTLGAISEGVAFQGLKWTLDESHVFEAFVTVAGFGILVYSLHA